jgi:hypothetical protein
MSGGGEKRKNHAKGLKDLPNYSYSVAAIFHHPGTGILMFKTQKGQLHLPNKKMIRFSDSKLGQKQISTEIIGLANLLEKKTNMFFDITTALALYYFLADQKIIKTFLVELSSEYKWHNIDENEEPPDPIIFFPILPHRQFIEPDPEKINKNNKILPNDKKIILDYLANRHKIDYQKQDYNIIRVQAIV